MTQDEYDIRRNILAGLIDDNPNNPETSANTPKRGQWHRQGIAIIFAALFSQLVPPLTTLVR
jgi:hypothetical protein